jgi:predicted nucleic acid-binding protein
MKKPLIYIPDASIIIAFLLQEDLWQKQMNQFFLDLKQEKIQCCVPYLWYYEVGNRLSRIKQKKSLENFSQFLFSNEDDLGFITIPVNKKQSIRAFALCKKYPRISFYDASYYALAQYLDGIFLTADKQYYALLKKEKNIEFITDYHKRT